MLSLAYTPSNCVYLGDMGEVLGGISQVSGTYFEGNNNDVKSCSTSTSENMLTHV